MSNRINQLLSAEFLFAPSQTFFYFYVVIHTFDYETRLHVLFEILYEHNLPMAALALRFLFNALVLVLYPKTYSF